jgi:Na+-transporting methylmalonyl-CoA/oxaloacetate decarboxylase gamma subunit
MRKIKILILLAVAFSFNVAFGQSSSFIKFNEIMVKNDSTYQDEYGYRSGWIEIFNAAFNNINIGGMYLTNDTTNPKKYYIPRNDAATNMSFRSFVVFFADNHPSRGTFHLNFTLEESKYVAIYEQDGKTRLDIIHIPADLKTKSNISYGKDLDQSITRQCDDNTKWIYETRFTPNQSNEWQDKITKSQQIKELDSTGMGMAVVSMAVVFVALIFIFFLLKSFTIADKLSTKKKLKLEEAKGKESAVAKPSGTEETGEICAAIAMALHLYASQYHDEESEVVTINKTIRPYSPWSQKHLNLKRNKR